MVETRKYTLAVRAAGNFPETRERVIEALKGEGFGVVTELDVRETLKQKIGADFRPYTILGACNPQIAHEALTVELDLGALMPCNVVVYSNGDGSCTVAAIDPEGQFGRTNNSTLAPLAKEARARLERVLQSIG